MKYKLLLIFTFFLIAPACPERDPRIKFGRDYRLQIQNLSDKSIYGYIHFSFPDSSIYDYPPNLDSFNLKANPNKTLTIGNGCCWEGTFKQEIKSDTLMIFIFDAKVLESTPWDTVRKNYMILARYDLTYKDLVKFDWTIPYPFPDTTGEYFKIRNQKDTIIKQ